MRKLTTYWLLLGIFFMSIISCSRAEQSGELKDSSSIVESSPLLGKKILIVYLSRTKNTKAVAQIIHEEVCGDLIALDLVTPYPENYQQIVEQVSRENNEGYLPQLKKVIEDIKQYDLVFLGFPTWGMQLPPPMKSFLNKYDLKDKTVIPFNTNAGYGIGSSFETVKKLCPESTLLEGYSTKGGLERDGIPYGRMGLTNYEMQGVLGCFIFSMWAFGPIFQNWGTTELFFLGIAIYIGQLLFSAFWLKKYL